MNQDAPAYGLWGLAMFPVLVVTYVRLAHHEESEVAAEFGPTWNVHAARTPQWFPRIGELIGDHAPRAEGRR